MREKTEILVLGSGVAGLTFALRAADRAEVTIVTKRAREEANTAWAQGGISAVFDPTDSFDAHVEDTLVAGAGLCKRDIVEGVVREAPERILDLETLGTKFDHAPAGGAAPFELGREGGHSARRVVHAGAEVADMEFYQFHPTVLYHPQAKSFLISEALRGEGGVLRLEDGTAFMKKHHAQADLAPRDVVARAIDYEMKRTGEDCVWLDMTHHPASFLERRFPNIHAECLRFGVDMTQRPLPVVPAAHYMCGGVTTDASGRTSIPGLWAIGEVACTGLHGANRLASNSLLEGLVFGRRAAEAMIDLGPADGWSDVPEWDAAQAGPSDEAVVVTQNWAELRQLMWNYVGIVRSDKRLQRAARRIALLQDEIREYYWNHFVTRDMLELRNIATVAELIVSSALFRRESRGLHYTTDHLATDPAMARDTVVKRGVPAHFR